MSDEHPSKEFLILLAAIVATGIIIVLACTVNVWKPAYRVDVKVVGNVLEPSAPGRFLAYSSEILPYEEHSSAHPCDPKELGCGVTYYHDGVASKVE